VLQCALVARLNLRDAGCACMCCMLLRWVVALCCSVLLLQVAFELARPGGVFYMSHGALTAHSHVIGLIHT